MLDLFEVSQDMPRRGDDEEKEVIETEAQTEMFTKLNAYLLKAPIVQYVASAPVRVGLFDGVSCARSHQALITIYGNDVFFIIQSSILAKLFGLKSIMNEWLLRLPSTVRAKKYLPMRVTLDLFDCKLRPRQHRCLIVLMEEYCDLSGADFMSGRLDSINWVKVF